MSLGGAQTSSAHPGGDDWCTPLDGYPSTRILETRVWSQQRENEALVMTLARTCTSPTPTCWSNESAAEARS